MVSLTENESRAMGLLIRDFSKSYNINQLAKAINISPGGMFKLLKKLKSRDYLKEEKLGNNIFYKINYNSSESLDTCTFILSEKKLTPYLKVWLKDLESLRNKTAIAILFGSALEKAQKAGDIDILLVFNRKDLQGIESLIDRINKIKPKKLHTVYQTKQDLITNIKKQDKVIMEIIKKGIILWGGNSLVKAIKDGQD